MRIEIEVDIEDGAQQGGFAVIERELRNALKCPYCNGSGIAFANDPPTGMTCEVCKGTGRRGPIRKIESIKISKVIYEYESP